VWSWPVSGAKFDEQIACIETYIHENREEAIALGRILHAIKEPFFTSYGSDRGAAYASADDYLTRLAYAVVVGAGPDRATYENHWMQDTGKTLKSARDLVARIKEMSTEIEKMNTGPLFVCARHAQLPAAMRRYAKFLGRRVEKIRGMPRPYTQPILYLTYTVKDWTGKYHDAEVARLLTAAKAALGREGGYEARNLFQARYRHKTARKT
jgi:hypothetical protein